MPRAYTGIPCTLQPPRTIVHRVQINGGIFISPRSPGTGRTGVSVCLDLAARNNIKLTWASSCLGFLPLLCCHHLEHLTERGASALSPLIPSPSPAALASAMASPAAGCGVRKWGENGTGMKQGEWRDTDCHDLQQHPVTVGTAI